MYQNTVLRTLVASVIQLKKSDLCVQKRNMLNLRLSKLVIILIIGWSHLTSLNALFPFVRTQLKIILFKYCYCWYYYSHVSIWLSLLFSWTYEELMAYPHFITSYWKHNFNWIFGLICNYIIISKEGLGIFELYGKNHRLILITHPLTN